MPQFAPHGSSIFEFDNQVLLLRSRGPFNAEHVRAVMAAYESAAERMRQGGPWATINVIFESMLLTADGIEAMGESAQRSRELGRCAAAYVVPQEVEGRSMIISALQKVCAGVLPIAFFTELDDARSWCAQQIAGAQASQPD
ncbi:hypothetical protein [Pseudomarimonas arenosa]|uniref:STAS/SEC14 domain-containing protein n=1 Tax=Pseudomarimonas arenosa TaxID=2774145 RepID=A0AAW3ZG51_9GAMM|nr:hypothetical protein [Pseudomarimonas arenosa]MBD8525108.1 hypothetical protein [Pseudomarimonas arenosa]